MKQNGQRMIATTEREDGIVPRYSRFDRKQRKNLSLYVESESPDDEGTDTSSENSAYPASLSTEPKTFRWRGGFALALVCVCGLGLLGGTYFARQRQALPALNEATLQGTWALQSIGSDPVGPEVASTVISQKISFAGGKLHGETVLRGDSPATAATLPFPDETVTRVVSSPDGHEVTATWDGSYTWLDERRLEFQVGKAKFLIAAHLDPNSHQLQLDQDAILTYRGLAHYQAAPAASAPQTR